MKQKVFLAMCVLLLFLGITAFADSFANEETVIKISMDGIVKRAKEIGSGNGIEFTLPALSDSAFNLYAVELAIFEKANTGTWSMYKDVNGAESKKQLINNPSSLKIQMDLGNVTDYRIGAKYKIAYRYFVQSTEDLSKIVIGGQDIKDGWRLVGEPNPTIATDTGFFFYPNTTPKITIDSITFQAEDIGGYTTFSYSAEEIETVWLPKDALSNGLQLNFTATDSDAEDSLTVSYTLTDLSNNSIISEGTCASGDSLFANTQSEYVKLSLTVTDNWGAVQTAQEINLMIDHDSPEVLSEFADRGKVLRGKNLYSKFTLIDSPNEVLSQGSVYYSIVKNGVTLYRNVSLPNNANGIYTVDLANMSDGEYDIVLTVFDKAHNKTIHTIKQKLDNTPPTVTFLTPAENESATLYSTWINISKKIIITATDTGAGIYYCSRYLDYSWQGSITFGVIPNSYTFSYNVATDKTGKLYYYFYIYDNAYTIDKTNNTVGTSSNGNYTFVSKYVWLDKTPPTVNIEADENTWYEAPVTIYASSYDYPSSSGVSDNSGVKSTSYCITQTEEPGTSWTQYSSSGVTFNKGGVYYLHVKSIDYAGNESTDTKKIKVNSKSVLLNGVTPTDDYSYTIYNRTKHNGKGVYIVKNTSYNTKYHYSLQDADTDDKIQTDILLVNADDPSIHTEVHTETPSTGTAIRDIPFNMPYILEDGSALPDGVYTMYLTISEIKNDGDTITTYADVVGCEVVIKRTSPPVPQINVSDISGGKKVTINYPVETLAGSLNNSYVSAMYKREYKVVEDKVIASNVYYPYTAPISSITKDCVVTALYTDCAGNVATATLRVFAGSESLADSIQTAGDTVSIEEGRASTTYYIGTRRDKQSGINSDIFNYLQ